MKPSNTINLFLCLEEINIIQRFIYKVYPKCVNSMPYSTLSLNRDVKYTCKVKVKMPQYSEWSLGGVLIPRPLSL